MLYCRGMEYIYLCKLLYDMIITSTVNNIVILTVKLLYNVIRLNIMYGNDMYSGYFSVAF